MKKLLLTLTSVLLVGALTACSASTGDLSGIAPEGVADGGMPSAVDKNGVTKPIVTTAAAAGDSYGEAAGTVPPSAGMFDFDDGMKYADAEMEGAAAEMPAEDVYTPYGNGIPQAAGTLTAGEWEDNDHYSFWRGLFQYTDTGWEEYRSLWDRDFCSRIFVTVSRGGRPVENTLVALYNGDGKNIWTAKTDNEGKAYLFYTASELSKGELTVKTDFGGEMTVNGEDQAVAFIIDDPNTAGTSSLDLALVVDTTGSMGDELSYIQKELEDVINRAAKDNGNIPVRLSVNFYRDDGDEYVVRNFDFTEDIASAISDLNAQSADGGGDYPEKVNAALDSAINGLSWNENSTKLLFIILDAPPHSEAAEDMNRLTSQAAEKGIRIIPILASGGDKETEFLMRDFALKTGGTYLFLTDDSGVSAGGHITPTTGAYTVEKLNDLMVKVINRYLAQVNTVAEYTDINIELPAPDDTVTYPPAEIEIPVQPKDECTVLLYRNSGNVLEFLLQNDTDREYSLARYFSLEKLDSGKWNAVESDEPINVTEDMIIIPSGESFVFSAPVYAFWKNLTAGKYRIVIENAYSENSTTGEFYTEELYGEFDIDDIDVEGEISMLLKEDPKKLGENDSLEYIVRNRTNHEYSYGLGFTLEKLVNEEWEAVPPDEDFAVNAVAIIVPPGENGLFSAPVYTYWKNMEDGVYRVGLSVWCAEGGETLYGQFDVVGGRIECGLWDGSSGLLND